MPLGISSMLAALHSKHWRNPLPPHQPWCIGFPALCSLLKQILQTTPLLLSFPLHLWHIMISLQLHSTPASWLLPNSTTMSMIRSYWPLLKSLKFGDTISKDPQLWLTLAQTTKILSTFLLLNYSHISMSTSQNTCTSSTSLSASTLDSWAPSLTCWLNAGMPILKREEVIILMDRWRYNIFWARTLQQEQQVRG